MRPRKSEDGDAALFREAVKDVKPLAPGKVQREPPRPVPTAISTPGNVPGTPIKIEDDGVSDFVADGQAQTVLRRLRRTNIREADHLDLHGKTLETYAQTLRAFVQSHQNPGEQHAILVIHGRGHRSPNKQPVLKQKVRIWLKSCDTVLAFCGEGPGALRVLLKRAP